MGTELVDQILPDGTLVQGVDSTLREGEKNELLLGALPGAVVETYAGVRVVRFEDQIILKKQITHLGRPWESFKKRIQIPNSWLAVERRAILDGLVPRFVGIYRHALVTIFVDFDPSTYVLRKANNSAAHVSTNDLFQAQTGGQFQRVDGRGNRLTSVRDDQFEHYLRTGYEADDRLEIIEQFNAEFLDGVRLESMDAVRQMHAADWRDTFQGEWPGFYLEHRFDEFLRRRGHVDRMQFQKVKRTGFYDYDLVMLEHGHVDFYGDLKSSDVRARESPGNDAEDFRRCLDAYGRFWYVIYEHETEHARLHGHAATIAWNEWKRSVGYDRGKPYDELSYAKRFKQAVRYVSMKVLEVNQANVGVVLRDFAQGRQPDGAARALKLMIDKRNIDNFLIYSSTAG